MAALDPFFNLEGLVVTAVLGLDPGLASYRAANPGSKLKTAVTEDKPTGKRAERRKSYCARSAGQMKKFPKAAKDPDSRLRQARKRWKC